MFCYLAQSWRVWQGYSTQDCNTMQDERGRGLHLEDEGVAGLDQDPAAAQLAVVALPGTLAPVDAVHGAKSHVGRLACMHAQPASRSRPQD